MSDDLRAGVQITADVSDLTAKLAVAKQSLAAYEGALKQQAAALLRAGNSEQAAAAALRAHGAAVAGAKAQVEQLTTALRSQANAARAAEAGAASLGTVFTQAFARMGAAVREPLDALAMMSSRLRQTAEIAGIAFVTDRLVEYAKRMGELGERTVYLSAAVGTTPHEFSLLTTALRLAGGEAGYASRTLEMLGRNLQEALTSKSSQAAKAVQSLGITQQELGHASRDLGFALDLLADKWASFQNDLTKSADFRALLGRGFETLIPILQRDSAAMEEFKAKAQETGLVLSNEDAKALAETGEKVHVLGATLEGAGVRGFLRIKGAIDSAIGGLTSFVTGVENAIAAVTQLDSAEAHTEALRRAKGIGGRFTGATTGPSGHWIFRAGKMRFTPYPALDPVPGDNLPFTLPPPGLAPPSSSAAAEPDKPRAAPWPTQSKGRGGGAGNDLSEMRLRIAEAQDDTAKIEAIYTEWLARQRLIYGEDSKEYRQLAVDKLNFEKRAQAERFAVADRDAEHQVTVNNRVLADFRAQMQAMADARRITAQQAIGFDIERTAQLRDQSVAAFRNAAASATTLIEKQRVDDQLETIMASSKTAMSRLATEWGRAGEQAAEKFAAPFRGAFDKIGSGLETAVTDLLLRKGTTANIGRQLYQSLVGEAVSGAGSVLSHTTVGLLPGSKPGEDLGTYLSRQLAELLLHSSLLAGILGNTAESAFAATAAAGTSAAGSIAGGGISAAGSVAGAASTGGGLFSWLGGLLAFQQGGIVPRIPSAAGGMMVPGKTLALLHAREMVLPAGIADSVKGMAEGGGGSGGDMHLHFHGPSDGPAVERWFKGLMARNPGVVRNMLRSNDLTPRTL